jgi:protein disulfide-isomerase-like protein
MKAQKLLEKGFKYRIKLIKTMFNSKNIKNTLLILGAILILYYFYKNYLKEGFESSASSFESDLDNDTKLVLFYADWCGHCKKFKPTWEETAKEVNVDGKKIMISVNVGEQDDNSKQLSEKYNVDGFPTIVIFSNGSMTGTYDGPRTKEGMMNILEG